MTDTRRPWDILLSPAEIAALSVEEMRLASEACKHKFDDNTRFCKVCGIAREKVENEL